MNNRRHRARNLMASILLIAAGACSTDDYGKPVGDFATATGEAKAALSELNVQVTEAYRGVLDAAILRGEVFLTQRDGDCQVGSERCRLVLVDENRTELEPYPPEPPLTRMTLLMSEIDDYASNLQALMQAETTREVEVQVNAALGSVQHLAETVAELSAEGGAPAASVPQFATPVGEAVNWVVGKYVERVKFRGLQRATEAARPVVRQAADLFTAVSTFASDVPKIELANEVTNASDAVRARVDGSSVDRYALSAAKYDALLTSSPPELFQRMADAHDALAGSLQGEDFTLATAGARISAFAAEAEKLAKILKDLRAVVPQDQEN